MCGAGWEAFNVYTESSFSKWQVGQQIQLYAVRATYAPFTRAKCLPCIMHDEICGSFGRTRKKHSELLA